VEYAAVVVVPPKPAHAKNPDPFEAIENHPTAAGIVVAVHVIPLVEYAAVVVDEATAAKLVPFHATLVQRLPPAAGIVVTVHVIPLVE
jgi:hypothetical protein